MEDHRTLKQLMDTLFENLSLQSYTIHEGKSGTTCKLKFSNRGGDTNAEVGPKITTYKKKSSSQVKRDRERLERHIRPHTRSQSSVENVEIARAGDSDIGRDALSDTGLSLSPEVGLCLEPDTNATVSQLASHSPAALNVQSTDATSDLSTETLLNVSQISLPAMDTADQLSHPAASDIVPQVTETEESIKRNEPSLEDYNYNWGYVCNLPYAVESHLFREHLASRYLEDKRKISWAQVHCNDCRMNVNKLSVRTKKRMTYCATCKIYFCGNCLELESICFCGGEPTFVT